MLRDRDTGRRGDPRAGHHRGLGCAHDANSAASKVDVYIATNALQDVHRVDAKPSLVARARNADLVVADGAELESAGCPCCCRSPATDECARHAGLFRGRRAAQAARGADCGRSLDGRHSPAGQSARAARSPQHRDRRKSAVGPARGSRPGERRLLRGARVGLPGHGGRLRLRAGHRPRRRSRACRSSSFTATRATSVRWLGLVQVATIEPKPGVPPSAGHLAELVKTLSAAPPRMILRNAYNDPKAADWLVGTHHAPVVTLPFSVGGTPAQRTCSGCSTIRSGGCSRCSDERVRGRSRHPVAGARCRPPGRACRTCRSVSRCSSTASCSSIWRSPRWPALGVIAAHTFGHELAGWVTQLAAVCAALLGRPAAHLDGAQATGGAGSADRHPVRAGFDRRRSCCSPTIRTAASSSRTCWPGRSSGYPASSSCGAAVLTALFVVASGSAGVIGSDESVST